MSDAPNTNWDMIHHWEWFRRSEWQPVFRAKTLGEGGGICRAFVELANIIEAQVALDCACGLGCKTICVAEKGLNILGADQSEVAVTHARELAAQENSAVTFFQSTWAELPRNVPHYFDAVLCDSLHLEPEWDRLGAAVVGIFHALRPGGFLMFHEAMDDAHDSRRLAAEEWNSRERECIDWLYRDGANICARLRQAECGADYIDERSLFVIHEHGRSRMESTTIRHPFYWKWSHWQELTRMAGFCHLETRELDGYGGNGGMLRVTVAWKRRDEDAGARTGDRESPYLD